MPSKEITKGGDLKKVKRTIQRKVKNTINDLATFVQVVSHGDPISLKRRVNVYPPQMRKLLTQIGDEPITDLLIVRAPIQSFVSTLLNVISLGTYEKAVHDSSYDKMFHLALRINDRYILDKQETVKLVAGAPPVNSEGKSVALQSQMTIQQLIDKTRDYMGAAAFSNYSAKENNCQKFVASILEANGLLTPELSEFIQQDAKAVFDKMPTITEKLGKFITDVGAIANRVVEGEGNKKRSKRKAVVKETPQLTIHTWRQYISQQTKGKKSASRDEVRANMKKMSAEYAALKGIESVAKNNALKK